jgi:molecular chaperone GrpE
MSKHEKSGSGPRPGGADDTETIEVQDSGQTLEGVLEEEERTALEESGARLRLAQKNFDELKDRHLRKLAEFENMRKRAERERSEYFRSALGGFLLDLFPISGVAEVGTSGPFDPNVHDAVATEPRSDVPKDTILDVLRKGYFLNDKLLRPALVKVAVPPEEKPRDVS